jgi:hypothetical protein
LTAWPRDALVVSTAANPNGLLGGYESGALEDARTFLSSWLAAYPRDGFFHLG